MSERYHSSVSNNYITLVKYLFKNIDLIGGGGVCGIILDLF